MNGGLKRLEQGLGPPIANASFAMMQGYIKSVQRRGVDMLHTARPFDHYRKVFFQGESRSRVLQGLKGKRVIDVGCGYTPYAPDSMFRACHDAGVDFYGVDPLLGTDITFGFRERALARATGGSGYFSKHAPGLAKALPTGAQDLPFEEASIDLILCSYLLFVWIEDEALLADILEEFLRVLKPGGVVKMYPLNEWRVKQFKSARLKRILGNFTIEQTFVHGRGDLRVMPSMLTEMSKA
ncbi:MAG: SAM-dependent methyltransferase [Halieaceae bacterium]|jgi:SAM-dependent methyltransferase